MSVFSKMPTIGVGAVVFKGDEVLLIRRLNPPAKGEWSLPGGRQEWGETVHQTAVREVREETGIDVAIRGLAGVVDLIYRQGRKIDDHFTVIDLFGEWQGGEAKAASDAEVVAWAAPEALAGYQLSEQTRTIIEVAREKRRNGA